MTDVQPLVSIVMATRNASRYLKDALDSIAAQTYPHVETIIVDGHSTDGTVEIAQRYARTTVLAQAQEDGFAGAWNQGIRAARGELIALLDSDDRWPPEKLAHQVGTLMASPGVMGVLGRIRFFVPDGVSMPSGFKPELLNGDHVAYIPGALLARRALFDRVGLFETDWKVGSDTDWFARVKDAGCPISILPEVVIYKRVHDTNLSYTTAEQTTIVNEELLEVVRRSILRQRAQRQERGPR